MAKKKVDVKVARREFVKRYSTEARDVLRFIAKGWDSVRIADKLDLPVTSVAAYRANVTRGAYLPFVDQDGQNGTCNF